MSNPYFKNTYNPGNNEFELYRRATDEIIEMHGVEFKWITKDLVNPDYIFGEDNLKNFNSNRTVTLYIENYEDFDGVDDMFSKFGFQIDNRLILGIERERFNTIIGKEPEIDDLIYHPNSGKLFQLKHIKDDIGFFQFNAGKYVYKLTFEIFIPSHEDFDTDIAEVDIFATETDIDTTDESDDFDAEEVNDLDLDESDFFGNL